MCRVAFWRYCDIGAFGALPAGRSACAGVCASEGEACAIELHLPPEARP